MARVHVAALEKVSSHLGVALERADIDRALARAGLGPSRSLKRLTGGNVNSPLLARLADNVRWVIKLGHPIFRPEKLLNEAHSLTAFRNLGLPFPKLRWVEARGPTLPVDWLIMAYVEGLPMVEVLAKDNPEVNAIADAYGHLLATIFAAPRGTAFGAIGPHGQPTPIPWFGKADPSAPRGPFETFPEWLDAEVREQLAGIGDDPRFRTAAMPLARMIRRLGRSFRDLRPGLVHGDFTAANIIVGKGSDGNLEIAAVVDCEWSHYGARELELLWAEKSLVRNLHPSYREPALERFRSRLRQRRVLTPKFERLAKALLELYEMNAFDWIAAEWSPTRTERELGARIASARELAAGEST